MIVSIDARTGRYTVGGVLWTDAQVRQAREDARACTESRGVADERRKSGIRPAAPCDCVACRIYKLRRHVRARYPGRFE